VVQWLALKTTNTEVPGYLNKEVTVRFGKLKMQLWDSMCCQPSTVWCSRERLSAAVAQPTKVCQSCSATDLFIKSDTRAIHCRILKIAM
jgi:hypothetical protein